MCCPCNEPVAEDRTTNSADSSVDKSQLKGHLDTLVTKNIPFSKVFFFFNVFILCAVRFLPAVCGVPWRDARAAADALLR